MTATNTVTVTSNHAGHFHIAPYGSNISPPCCVEYPAMRNLLSAHSRTHWDCKYRFQITIVAGFCSLLSCICCRQASEWQLDGSRKWWKVCILELGVWLGIVLWIGVHSSPAVRDYWKYNQLNPTHSIHEHIGPTWFEEIKIFFHVSSLHPHEIETEGSRWWHHKVEVNLEKLWNSLLWYGIPSIQITYYIFIVGTTGQTHDMYLISSKPMKYVFKFHCQAHDACFNNIQS